MALGLDLRLEKPYSSHVREDLEVSVDFDSLAFHLKVLINVLIVPLLHRRSLRLLPRLSQLLPHFALSHNSYSK